MKTNLKDLSKTFVRQQGQSDCGVACLLSVIKFHKGYSSLDIIRQKSGTTKTGTTILGLFQAANQLGFDAKGLEAESVENLKELKEPAILHVVLENRLQHYVVFYGFNEKEQLIIGDPGSGIELWGKEKLKDVWKSRALLKLTTNDSFKVLDQKSDSFKWVRKWIKEDFNILLAALFLGLLIAVFNLSSAIFTQKLIDVILPQRELGKLFVGISLFGILLLFKVGLGFVRGTFLLTQSRDFNNRMIQYFFGSLIRLPKSFFDSKKSGEMIARMNDTRRIQTTVSSLVGNLIIEVLVVITSLVAVFLYSWQMGILVLFIIPIFLILNARFSRPIQKKQKEVMASYGLNESNYIDTINGISEIKSHSKLGLFERITFSFYDRCQGSIFDLGRVQIKFSSVIEIVMVLMTLAVISYSSYLYFEEVLALGELMAVVGLSGSIGPSLTKVIVFNIQFQEAKVAFERMQEFANVEQEDVEGTDIEEFAYNELSLKNVSFNYPGSLDLIKEINLDIKRGKVAALLGESGEGKSTIIQLIQRFYSLNNGMIQLGDYNINKFNLEAYRNKISVVSQDTKLFNNYLLFNIALSEDPQEYEHLVKWCESIGFGEYFRKFPQGYMTLLGEEGANISGGQRQLVALARALYKKPKFLLMDESTSAMDINTERFVFELIESLKSQMGVLFVTHRIKTAAKADYIYILENGQISTKGKPGDLLHSDNLFSQEMNEITSVIS